MSRYYKRRYDDEEDPIAKILSVVVVVYILSLVYFYKTNSENFWHWLLYGIIFVIVISGLMIGYKLFKQKRAQAHLDKLLKQIRSAGQEGYIQNFINRFGLENRNIKGWTFRSHNFDFARINDLEKVLLEHRVDIRHNESNKDIYKLLRYYIQEKEEALTRESIKTEPQKYSLLSGSDFEKLLYRLFEAIGYKVEYIGKTGDQGGDLIANRNGERILIQAKCYKDWSVGNAAVQQVVGAMKFYDCNKTMVITTSSNFTKEADILAHANHTDLVSKNQLTEMLIKYLGENWV